MPGGPFKSKTPLVEKHINGDEKENRLEIFNCDGNDYIPQVACCWEEVKDQAAIVKENKMKARLDAFCADDRGRQALAERHKSEKANKQEKENKDRARKMALDSLQKRTSSTTISSSSFPDSVQTNSHEKERNTPIPSTLSSEIKGVTLCVKVVETEEKLNAIHAAELENARQKKLAEEKAILQDKRKAETDARFQAAWKKECKEQEHAETLKMLQHAERLTRYNAAQQASNLNESMTLCPPVDEMIKRDKQNKMETVVEDVFRKNKEHAIEDLEGYHDDLEDRFNKKMSETDEDLNETTERSSVAIRPYSSLLRRDSFENRYQLTRERSLDEASDDIFETTERTSVTARRPYSSLLRRDSFENRYQLTRERSLDDIFNTAYLEESSETTVHPLTLDRIFLLRLEENQRQGDKLLQAIEQEVMPILLREEAKAAAEASRYEFSDESSEESSYEYLETRTIAVQADESTQPESETETVPDAVQYVSKAVQADLELVQTADQQRAEDYVIAKPAAEAQITEKDSRTSVELPGRPSASSDVWSSSSYRSLPSKHGMPALPSLYMRPQNTNLLESQLLEESQLSTQPRTPSTFQDPMLQVSTPSSSEPHHKIKRSNISPEPTSNSNGSSRYFPSLTGAALPPYLSSYLQQLTRKYASTEEDATLQTYPKQAIPLSEPIREPQSPRIGGIYVDYNSLLVDEGTGIPTGVILSPPSIEESKDTVDVLKMPEHSKSDKQKGYVPQWDMQKIPSVLNKSVKDPDRSMEKDDSISRFSYADSSFLDTSDSAKRFGARKKIIGSPKNVGLVRGNKLYFEGGKSKFSTPSTSSPISMKESADISSSSQSKKDLSNLSLLTNLSQTDLDKQANDKSGTEDLVISPPPLSQSPVDDITFKKLQMIHHVLLNRLTELHNSQEIEGFSTTSSDADSQRAVHRPVVIGRMPNGEPFIYHELSTIQELDSALSTSMHVSNKSVSDDETEMTTSLNRQSAHRKLDISPLSLVNVPLSDVSHLIQDVRFIPCPSENAESYISSPSMVAGDKSPTLSTFSLEPMTPQTETFSNVQLKEKSNEASSLGSLCIGTPNSEVFPSVSDAGVSGSTFKSLEPLTPQTIALSSASSGQSKEKSVLGGSSGSSYAKSSESDTISSTTTDKYTGPYVIQSSSGSFHTITPDSETSSESKVKRIPEDTSRLQRVSSVPFSEASLLSDDDKGQYVFSGSSKSIPTLSSSSDNFHPSTITSTESSSLVLNTPSSSGHRKTSTTPQSAISSGSFRPMSDSAMSMRSLKLLPDEQESTGAYNKHLQEKCTSERGGSLDYVLPKSHFSSSSKAQEVKDYIPLSQSSQQSTLKSTSNFQETFPPTAKYVKDFQHFSALSSPGSFQTLSSMSGLSSSSSTINENQMENVKPSSYFPLLYTNSNDDNSFSSSAESFKPLSPVSEFSIPSVMSYEGSKISATHKGKGSSMLSSTRLSGKKINMPIDESPILRDDLLRHQFFKSVQEQSSSSSGGSFHTISSKKESFPVTSIDDGIPISSHQGIYEKNELQYVQKPSVASIGGSFHSMNTDKESLPATSIDGTQISSHQGICNKKELQYVQKPSVASSGGSFHSMNTEKESLPATSIDGTQIPSHQGTYDKKELQYVHKPSVTSSEGSFHPMNSASIDDETQKILSHQDIFDKKENFYFQKPSITSSEERLFYPMISGKESLSSNDDEIKKFSDSQDVFDRKASEKPTSKALDSKQGPSHRYKVQSSPGSFHTLSQKELSSPTPTQSAVSKQLESRDHKPVAGPSLGDSRPCTPTGYSSGSEESLSKMFTGSKIVHQSTPIKAVQELAQEAGILEEPDLTLIGPELTTYFQSPEKPRKPSTLTTSIPEQISPPVCDSTLVEPDDGPSEKIVELDAMPKFSLVVTAAERQDPCDVSISESMISFHKHEMSALHSVNEHVSLVCTKSHASSCNTETPSTSAATPENSREYEERLQSCQTSSKKSSGNDYRVRTKRLWDNLEEVKERRMAEERKKNYAKNREKAKELALKIQSKRQAVTPKRKG